jgi:phosphoglycolate phosphatase-like HAD superfamily hydrolase
MVKTVIFDFDGVIVESTDIKTEAFAKLFESKGADIVKKVVSYHKDNMGLSRYDKIRHIYSDILRLNLDNDEFEALCARFASLVVDAVIAAPYVKGAEEFLAGCMDQYSFFIVSATPQDEIRYIVKRRQLDRFFKAVFGAPLAKRDAVKTILEKEQIEPRNAVVIGDAMSDYSAAKDNDAKFIARVNGDNDVFKNVSCLKIADLSGLSAILKNI